MSEILLLTISTAEPTKRGILGKVAKIYDPLGLASPVTLSGKMLFRDTCDTKFAWDSPLPSDLQAKWKKWEQGLPEHVNAPRNVVKHVGKILSIDLRTEGSTPFEVIGVDFAGPIKYRIRAKTEGKAYLALCACSLTRGLLLEVLPNLATSEFLRSLKRLIARRGRPEKIYSDNGKTFVGAEKWLKQVMRDEKTQDYLAHENIK